MKKFLIENRVYNNIMRAAAKHVSQRSEKPTLKGVYVEVERGKVRFTALDGYRIVHYAIVPAMGSGDELASSSFIMPPMLMPSRNAKDAYIEIDYSDVDGEFGRVHVTDKVEDMTISRRVICGAYVDYRRVITPEYKRPVSIVFNVQYLSDALFAALATCDRLTSGHFVKLTFDGSNPTLPMLITKRGAYGDATNLALPIRASDASAFDGDI